jgi:predicted nucleic-acid-binding protein
MKVTLDTNVLVRLATQDDPAQAALALKVLQKAELIAVPTPALCELVWVLLRGYRYTPAQVAHALRALMQVSQVVCHTTPRRCLLDWRCFEGDLLGGSEFVSFDQQAVKLLKTQKRKARLL